MYSYYVVYKDKIKITLPVPLPASGKVSENISMTNSKMKILYGITIRGFKGADYSLAALNKIKDNYSDKVEVIIIKRLSFIEYLKVLDTLVNPDS